MQFYIEYFLLFQRKQIKPGRRPSFKPGRRSQITNQMWSLSDHCPVLCWNKVPFTLCPWWGNSGQAARGELPRKPCSWWRTDSPCCSFLETAFREKKAAAALSLWRGGACSTCNDTATLPASAEWQGNAHKTWRSPAETQQARRSAPGPCVSQPTLGSSSVPFWL